jgi:GGDEF domain-containing protein
MQMPVHVSVGITEIRQQDTKEEMLRRADSALYTSKKRGKAQCTIYREE